MRRLMGILLLGMLLLSSCAGMVHTDAPMEHFTFSHFGMSTGSIYTMTAERTDSGWKAHFDLFCTHEFEVPLQQAEADELVRLMDELNLWKWNGFDRADRRVEDGEGFSLNVRFADGTKISASGDNAFPEGYADAEEAIRRIFIELLEKNGIDNPF